MILSASRRTDIPAFYSDWFYNRIKAKYVYTRNPMYPSKISRINLSPDVVDCIVFWTKNPRPMLSRLNELKDYNYYFQYTINCYPKFIEPNLPNIYEAINTFEELSNMLGKERVIWRYDPIISSKDFDISYHTQQFDFLATYLEGYTDRCIISFLDLYKKIQGKMSSMGIEEPTQDWIFKLAKELSDIAKKYNIKLYTCAEKLDLADYGIIHAQCIDKGLIESLFGFELDLVKDANQRPLCGCFASVDIGDYNTCNHQCVYCYANNDKLGAKLNKHNPESSLLIGEVSDSDEITERKVQSYKKVNLSIF